MVKINKIRKEQMHHSTLNTWNYRGTHLFAPTFLPEKVLTGDNWVSAATGVVVVDDPVINPGPPYLDIYPGDMVIALVDNPEPLSYTTANNGDWKVIRNSGSVGSKMVAESIFYVSAENYNSITKRLTIAAFPTTFFEAGDNVNIKVNSASYNSEAFATATGSNQVVWKPGVADAGFDLENGDLIEIEVFRN